MLVRFFRDRRGTLSIMTVFMMASLAGMAGLVAEYGNGLFHRIQDQRLADAAAVAGATVYDETSSATSMTSRPWAIETALVSTTRAGNAPPSASDPSTAD